MEEEGGRGGGRDCKTCMIYAFYAFFLGCLITGGVFLCLYTFLDDEHTRPWYPLVGMTLLCIPWLIWFLAYGYQCCVYPILEASSSFRATSISASSIGSGRRSGSSRHSISSQGSNRRFGSSRKSAHQAMENPLSPKSPMRSPRSPAPGSARHVHFGGVVVLSSREKSGGGEEGDKSSKSSNSSREDSLVKDNDSLINR